MWVTPYLPGGTAGGAALHEYELLRHAAREHELHLLSGELPPGPQEFELDGTRITAEGVAFKRRRAPSSRLEVARGLLFGWPTMQPHWQGDMVVALRRAVARRTAGHGIDLLHLRSEEIAPVAAGSPAPVALLVFDVLSRQLRREVGVTSTRRGRLAWQLEAGKLARWERRWLSRVEGLACVSSEDRNALRGLVDREVELVPNPVPDSFFESPSVPRSTAEVVFVGHLHYRANIDAVTWLTSEIWPRVADRRPDARLRVVGYDPHPDVLSAARSVGAEVHPHPPDIRPFYWAAAAAVAPVRLGSGIRNKVLHAMACRTPLVCTRTALEGIGAGDAHALIADDAPGFARAIVQVLDDRAAADRRAQAALSLLEPYRAEAVVGRLMQWWDRTARSR